MAAPRKGAAAKRAPKPRKITGKQLALVRNTDDDKRTEQVVTDAKTLVVNLDGPLRCLVPIPRNDVPHGTKSWRYLLGYDYVTYVLVGIRDDGVHEYRWENHAQDDDTAEDGTAPHYQDAG